MPDSHFLAGKPVFLSFSPGFVTPVTPVSVPVHGELPVCAANIITNETHMQVIDMYKLIIFLAAVFLLGEQSLGLLEQIQNGREILIALTISLVALPWIVTQIDN
jgi:hypothetical protein